MKAGITRLGVFKGLRRYSGESAGKASGWYVKLDDKEVFTVNDQCTFVAVGQTVYIDNHGKWYVQL